MKFLFARSSSNLSVVTVLVLIATTSVLFQTPAAGAFAARTTRSTTMARRATNENETEGRVATPNLQTEKVERITWNPLRLMVLKLGFTELRWTSPLNYEKKDGVFKCAYCGLELFDSDGKYDSGSGWPSFWRSIKDGHVKYNMEWDGRLECKCGRCSSHLGHVFLDGPRPSKVPKEVYESAPPSDPRGKNPGGYLPRFCVNGASMTFEKKE